MRRLAGAIALFLAWPMAAAELKFDFSQYQENESPTGFVSAVTGEGKPGDWKVVWDETASPFQSFNTSAPSRTRHAVIAQLSRDKTDEHFPLFIYDKEVFGDFTMTARIKAVKGEIEQMAGIAFHIQNPSNYYVVRASSLGSTFKFYKIVDGQRGLPVGPEMPIKSGEWHDILVEMKGDNVRCALDGKDLINVRDKANPFTSGRIGFWTKSDSVSYFADPKIIYKPHVPSAQSIVERALETYPRLVDLQLFVKDEGTGEAQLLASKSKNNDMSSAKNAREVIRKGSIYYGKTQNTATVLMPLRDRNGDSIAAVKVVMKAFPGQTEQNALVRALPVVKSIQGSVQSLQDLTD
jgi:hypothetical protein